MNTDDLENDEGRPEYQRSDFGKMVRGKYAARLAAESNIVVLDAEVSKVFPNAKSVNDALRALIDIASAEAGKTTPGKAVTRTSARQPGKTKGAGDT